MVPQIPHPVKNTGSINKATLVVDRHTFYMHSDIDGCTCLVSDCLFRVHQSWRDSWENLVSHILWRVAAASDSQAVQSSGAGRREGVLQRTEEGRCQHTLLGLNGKRKREVQEVQLRNMCDYTVTYWLDNCVSNSGTASFILLHSHYNMLTPVSRYCAILLMQMVVLVRMAACAQQDKGTWT